METTEDIEYNDIERLNVDSSLETAGASNRRKPRKSKQTTRTRSSSVRNTSERNGDKNEKPKVRASVKETGSESMRYYMKTMGNHELLGKNEEQILGKQIQMLIKWEGIREELAAKLMR